MKKIIEMVTQRVLRGVYLCFFRSGWPERVLKYSMAIVVVPRWIGLDWIVSGELHETNNSGFVVLPMVLVVLSCVSRRFLSVVSVP
jgi:hypothetical protein